MIAEVVRIVVSCVLFVQMGLGEAVQQVLQLKWRIASCPKCLTWWTTLAYLLVSGNGLLVSVATSFVASYVALWLALLYDVLAYLYNNIYEQITKETDTDEADENSDSAASI